VSSGGRRHFPDSGGSHDESGQMDDSRAEEELPFLSGFPFRRRLLSRQRVLVIFPGGSGLCRKPAGFLPDPTHGGFLFSAELPPGVNPSPKRNFLFPIPLVLVEDGQVSCPPRVIGEADRERWKRPLSNPPGRRSIYHVGRKSSRWKNLHRPVFRFGPSGSHGSWQSGWRFWLFAAVTCAPAVRQRTSLSRDRKPAGGPWGFILAATGTDRCRVPFSLPVPPTDSFWGFR